METAWLSRRLRFDSNKLEQPEFVWVAFSGTNFPMRDWAYKLLRQHHGAASVHFQAVRLNRPMGDAPRAQVDAIASRYHGKDALQRVQKKQHVSSGETKLRFRFAVFLLAVQIPGFTGGRKKRYTQTIAAPNPTSTNNDAPTKSPIPSAVR